MPELAMKLVAILEAYFTKDEFRELSGLFGLEIVGPSADFEWMSASAALVTGLDSGNSRRLLDALLDLATSRNTDGIAHTSWETQAYHRELSGTITDAVSLLDAAASPSEVTISGGALFSAKSKVRELLEAAEGEVFIVDPYIGVGTLDCLRDVEVQIRLLTGAHPQAIEMGFEAALVDFVAEGGLIEVRRASGLHDRHILFNDRCWLVGSSLKDAGKKAFNCIEVVDKGFLVADLEEHWTKGQSFP